MTRSGGVLSFRQMADEYIAPGDLSRRQALRSAFLSCVVGASAAAAQGNPRFEGATVIPLLPPGRGNPRNTEGAFVTLRDRRILFAYTRFTGGGGDDDEATIVGRYSKDGGRTWETEDHPIVDREGARNVMSVSFLRLRDGRIALFYLRKASTRDCRPYLRCSTDEGRSWSDPTLCIADNGYFVLNNDRAVQLASGRIVLPVALHPTNGKGLGPGTAMTYLSDDFGTTWRRGTTVLQPPPESPAGFQEPGVVQLKDGRVMMFMRTMTGSQHISYSRDGGETWSPSQASSLQSPLSPASIKRIPSTRDLLAVWNDHDGADPSVRAHEGPRPSGGKRTPLTVAISHDQGLTWIHRRNLLDDPAGWYCYTAIHFAGRRVLLAFNDGGGALPLLSRTSIAWFDTRALYRGKP